MGTSVDFMYITYAQRVLWKLDLRNSVLLSKVLNVSDKSIKFSTKATSKAFWETVTQMFISGKIFYTSSLRAFFGISRLSFGRLKYTAPEKELVDFDGSIYTM